ncbi:MAG: apolipoprotein N-acyltransferase [Perlucidibaca sp.]
MNRLTSLLARLRQVPASPWSPLLLGALMPLGLAPLDWWPVALLALAGLVELLRGQMPRRAARTTYLFGLGLWLHGGSWLLVSMHDYGNTSWPLSLGLLAFVAAGIAVLFLPVGWLYARLRLQRLGWLALPALLVLGEWLRSWLFSGFPWLMQGYGFIDTPLAGWAPLTGIYGVSLAAGISGCALPCLLRGGRQALAPGLSVALIWTLGLLLAPLSWTDIDRAQPFTVSLVQGDIPQESKWALEWRDKTVKIYRDLSASEWGRDLVLWPEAAIPMFAHEAKDVLAAVDNDALKARSAFVTGIPFATWNRERTDVLFYNSIAAMGDGFGLYHKQQLVPIGEYIPFEKWLRGAIPFFDLPMSSFSWGPADQPPLTVKAYAMAPFICYEVAYPSLVQRMSRRADFLATISNDGWFGHSIGPEQHFEMVRMRARETGRYMVRATNNGITAIIDEHGRVVAEAPRFQPAVLRGEIWPARGLTPWQRYGVTPVLVLCGLILLLAWRQGRQQERLQR